MLSQPPLVHEVTMAGHTICRFRNLWFNSESYCTSQSFTIKRQSPWLTCSQCTVQSSSHDQSAQTVCLKKNKTKKRPVHSCCVLWLLTIVSIPIKIQLKAPRLDHFAERFTGKLTNIIAVNVTTNVSYAIIPCYVIIGAVLPSCFRTQCLSPGAGAVRKKIEASAPDCPQL